jgi:DNA (cytosine-5)-methyltransferase 1
VIYGSVCSGIEAASVAWHPLGWTPAFFSEIEAFPRAVLTHHYPEVPLHGDFTTIERGQYAEIDVLVGGTPCQDFSIAGLRAGLDGDRGNLSLEFLRLADRLRPRWLVWENVPGVLSANEGRAFGAILGALAQLGYGWAYRVLDAQFFGVPQRRRRVFVVGCFGDAGGAAAVLFERDCLSGNPTPRRQARKDVAGTLSSRSTAGGGLGTDFDLDGGLTTVAGTLKACAGKSGTPNGAEEADRLVVAAFASREIAGALTSNYGKQVDSSDTNLGPKPAITCKDYGADAGALSPTLRALEHDKSHANGGGQVAVAFSMRTRDGEPQAEPSAIAPAIRGSNGGSSRDGAAFNGAVRRLTPRECERLQGFPDDYTAVPYRGKPASDGPRYRALGNSMAVPCMRWIGERLAIVDELQKESRKRYDDRYSCF